MGSRLRPDTTYIRGHTRQPLPEHRRPERGDRARLCSLHGRRRDGRVLAGVVRAEGASAIRVTDTNAKVTTLNRDEIDQIRPSGTSIMPVGLAGGLRAV